MIYGDIYRYILELTSIGNIHQALNIGVLSNSHGVLTIEDGILPSLNICKSSFQEL